MRRLRWTAATLSVLVAACLDAGEPLAPAPQGWDPETRGIQSEGASRDGESPVELPGELNYHGTAQFDGDDTRVTTKDSFFEPTVIATTGDGVVAVEVHNAGDLTHTFTIDELGLDVTVPQGQSIPVEVPLPEDGPLRFYCAFHDQLGMQGAFVPAPDG